MRRASPRLTLATVYDAPRGRNGGIGAGSAHGASALRRGCVRRARASSRSPAGRTRACRSASLSAMRSATSCEQPAWTSTSSRHSTTCCCTSERGLWALRSDRSRSCHESMVADAAHGVFAGSPGIPAPTLRAMASEDQLLAAAAAAKPFAAAGEEVVGVLVADPFDHGLVFLCALGPPAEDEDDDPDDVPELGWIAVDPDGLALDRRAARAGGVDARRALRDRRGGGARARRRRDRGRGRARARASPATTAPSSPPRSTATREAALAAAAFGDGLRVARTGYVDQLGDAARALGGEHARAAAARRASSPSSLSAQPLRSVRARSRASVWGVLERARARGRARALQRRADRRRAGAISAFAEDVLEHYRARSRRRRETARA